jgi:predicted sulfurtransferase
MRKVKTIILALLAVCITLGILWYGHRPVILKKATHVDVLAEAQRGGYRLVSTEKLWELFSRDADKLLIVDTRQEWEFRTGHIKGALNFPMEPTWWARWRKASYLKAFLGADKDRTIVFY